MKKMKIWLMNLAKKNLIFRNLFRKIIYITKSLKYKMESIFFKVDDKVVFFSCFDGKSYTCSPKAIYEYMIKNEKYSNYNFIWAFKDPDKYSFLRDNKNTILVKTKSNAYNKYLHISKYWILNYKISDYITPKKEQVFVQCWHGTPLKRLGCDLIHYDNVLNTVEGTKKRYRIEAKKFSYFISPSKYASDRFKSAWNLGEIGKENIIIEKGYPRNDFLYNYTEDDVRKIKEKIIKNETNKKIILYAPTYRADQHESGIGYVYKEEINFDKLKKELEKDFIILFRAHYFVANKFDFEKYKGFVYNVSDIDDVNELYIISDMLITDYSSVFFDYANLKRPMIFYMYDLEYYRDESNGFYFNVEEELPGKIVKTEDELIKEVINISNNFRYDEKYKKFNEKYNYLDDGNATKRVVEGVIG